MIGMKVTFTLKEQMPESESKKVLAQLVDVYKQVPGLKQKYFLADPKTGKSGGIYAFENQEVLEAYLNSDVWKNIVLESAQEEPEVETFVIIAALDAGVLL